MMKKIIEVILGIVFIACISVPFFFIVEKTLEGSERTECEQWRQQAKEYPLWYSVEWQRKQCEHYGLPLPK